MNAQHPTSNAQHPTAKVDVGQAAERRYDLEDRLLEYAASVIRLVEQMTRSRAGYHVGGQLLRSATSPLFNHGEAQAAESPDDFVHKMSICLKELRDSKRALRLLKRVPLIENPGAADPLLGETEELIRIFVTSIRTAGTRRARENGIDAYAAPHDRISDREG